MPEPARRRPRISLAWPLRATLLAVLLATTIMPSAALAAPPAETCRPDETRGAGGFSDICGAPQGGGGGGGIDLTALLPIVGVIAVGGLVLLIAAAVFLRRTSTPLVPADPGEWWTCRSCGKTNVLGSARCYACGTWQR